MEFTENNEANTSQSDNVEEEQNDESLENLIPGYETFNDYLEKTYDVMKSGIKTANNLPAENDFQYYTCFPSFNNARNKSINLLQDTMHTIMKRIIGYSNITKRNIEEKFDLLLDINDHLLDQANMLMDEESGTKHNPQVELIVSQIPKAIMNYNSDTNSKQINNNSEKIRLLGGKNIQRPQLMFKDKIDNSPKPWIPRIKEKPNSLKPLALYVEETEFGEVFNNPYEFELDKFKIPECQLKKRVPVKYKSLNDTKFEYIETPSELKTFLEDLKNYKEIAIDLEHHSYRTFQGITCLMQISTLHTDYLIDTLTLRSELHQLNEIFTKPSILKVFHGADMDILWLQRDLSLYVVNMFDTHQAAVHLNLPYRSLMKLLKKYCNVDLNKHFQLADWRIRPLTLEMMKYAREDTHYLLHMKDILINELIDTANGKTNLLKAVYDKSTDICKRIYVKPVWTEENCINLYRKEQKIFNNKQMYAFIQLHKWRDEIARAEDDSTEYVLPKQMLLSIAENLPREMQGILSCCNLIPPLVRQNLLQIHKIVLKAREEPLVKTIPEQDRQKLIQQTHIYSGKPLFDIPSGTEPRADLPCLLDKKNMMQPLNKYPMVKPTVTIFDSSVTSKEEESKDNSKKIIFKSPFMRYKCVIPMIVQQEAKEHAEKQKKKEEESQKEEEEKCEEKSKESECINKIEIDESKNRVHEHFKQISEKSIDNQISSKKKKQTQILAQMHGRKRKKESDIAHENQEKDDTSDFSTPTPSLDAKIVHMSKKAKQEARHAIEELKLQQSLVQIQNDNKSEIESLRNRKKGEKKTNEKLLKQQGMLPSKTFDYKLVDFNSFQGGSMEKNANQTQFQLPKQKKKEKYRNKKKQKKINI